MTSGQATIREIEHTADLGIEVLAPDLKTLFAVAGDGLFALIADPKSIEPRETLTVSAVGNGPEELLHSWLCELLAEFNVKGFVAKKCEVSQISKDRVVGTIQGEILNLSRHRFHTEIKGVTYHGFKVWEDDGAWHATVIFDV